MAQSFPLFSVLALVCSVLQWYHAVRPTLTIAVQMNMSASCNSNLKATQGNRLRNWRLDYGVRKQCKADVSKVRSSQFCRHEAHTVQATIIFLTVVMHHMISPSHQVPCLCLLLVQEAPHGIAR